MPTATVSSSLRRFLPLLLSLPPLLVLTVWYQRPVARQARLNARLVAALHAHDEDGAIAALAQGADPNTRDHYRTPPTLYVRLRHPDAAKEDDLDRAEEWEPVLTSAVVFDGDEERSDRLVTALLKRGAAVNGRDWRGSCVLFFATAQGRLDWVKAFLDRGADAGCRAEALQSASVMGRADVARLLIARGADVNTRDSSGDTPLMNACVFRNIAITRLLLTHGADPNLRGHGGETALRIAAGARRPDPQLIPLLKQHGARL